MQLKVRDVERGGPLVLDDFIPAGAFPLDTPDRPSVVGPVSVHVKAEVQTDLVLVWGTAVVRLEIQCGRCLERYSFEENLSFDFDAPITQEFLDVGEEIRQAVMVALPVQPLCRTNCRGLCPGCGHNLNKSICSCVSERLASPFDVLSGLNKNKG